MTIDKMKTVYVDASQVKLPDHLKEEIEHCEDCRTARLCLAFCCPRHFAEIKVYVAEVEKAGNYVKLNGDS